MEETSAAVRQPFALMQLLRNGWFSIPVLLYWLTGILLKMQLAHGEEILWLNEWRIEPFNTLFKHITQWGEWPPYILFGLLFARWNYRIMLVIACTGLLTIPASIVLKRTFKQPRPTTYFEQNGTRDHLVTVPDTHIVSGLSSFPSGHTFAAFSLYALLTLAAYETHRSRRVGLLFAMAAILTGFSRVFLAQHFLSDILAGSIAGIAWGALCWQAGLYFRKFPRLQKGWQ